MTDVASGARLRLIAGRVLAAAVAFVAAVALVGALPRAADTGLPIGGHDFIAYWSAFDVARDGGNPYSDEALQSSQVEVSPRYASEAQRYWNPPWALVPLIPVLALPFATATATWFVLGVLGGVGCAWLSWRVFVSPDRAPPPLVLAASLVFLPFLSSLNLGQMAVPVALIVLGLLWALQRGHDVLAGVLVGMLAIKPQAVLLVLVAIGVHVLVARRWRVVGAAVATVATLVGSSLLLLPSVWSGWDLSEASPTHWHSATISGWIRSWLPTANGSQPQWPLAAVPAVAIVGVLVWTVRRPFVPSSDATLTLLVLSALCAPYAWVADSMVALPVAVVALAGVVRPGRWPKVIGATIIAGQCTAVWIRSLDASSQQHMIVVPLFLLAVHAVRVGHDRATAVETAQPPVLAATR